MLMSLTAPLLALALHQSAAAAPCAVEASAGVYPPPGCIEREYQGTCFLQCNTSPFIRPCGEEQ